MHHWERLLARNLLALQPFAIVALAFEGSNSLTARALGGEPAALVFVAILGACMVAILWDWLGCVRGRRTVFSDHMSGITLATSGLLAVVAIFSAASSTSFVLPFLYVWAAVGCAYASHGYASDANKHYR